MATGDIPPPTEGQTFPVGLQEKWPASANRVAATLQTLFARVRKVFTSSAKSLAPRSGEQSVPTNPSSSDDLRQTLKKAKTAERQDVLSAYQKVNKDSQDMLELCKALNASIGGTIENICIDAIARDIMRQARLKGKQLSLKQATEMASALCTQAHDKKGVEEIVDKQQWKDLYERYEVVGLYSKAMANLEVKIDVRNKQYRELCAIVTELANTIESATEDPQKLAKTNARILFLLRKAQQSEAYAFLRHDEKNPAIAYVHRLAMASFLLPKPLTAHQQVVEPMVQTASRQNGFSFVSVLRRMRTAARKARLMVSDKTAEYALVHWRQVFGALKSFIPGASYDPKLAENASGALFEEKATIKGRPVTLSAVYTPSPTVGDQVSPEAEAFLQALENRQFMKPEQLALEPDYAQQTHWTFASLQNLGSRSEGGRARAIMELNTRYPLSFTGITVTQDSPFYIDGAHGGTEEKVEKGMVAHGEVAISEQYRDDMKKQLDLREGYFFPISRDDVKIRHAYEQIVDRAFEIVSKTKHPERAEGESGTDYKKRLAIWQWEQKAAFRELVHLGIVRYWQLRSIASQGQDVISLCCKECIDRGAKTMGEYLWALGDGSEDGLKAALYAVQGRALLARNRVIIASRLEPLVALSQIVPQDQAHEFLTKTVAGIAAMRVTTEGAKPVFAETRPTPAP